MEILKKSFPYIIIVILLLVIKSNLSAIFVSLSNSKASRELKQELEAKIKENEYLKEQLKYVKTDEFVKDQAQTKLGLLQPGEYFVIAPTAAPLKNSSQVADDRPNWKKWWELFF